MCVCVCVCVFMYVFMYVCAKKHIMQSHFTGLIKTDKYRRKFQIVKTLDTINEMFFEALVNVGHYMKEERTVHYVLSHSESNETT